MKTHETIIASVCFALLFGSIGFLCGVRYEDARYQEQTTLIAHGAVFNIDGKMYKTLEIKVPPLSFKRMGF